MKWLMIPVALLAVGSFGQTKLEKPKAGSAVRKAILDALRPSIEKDLKQKVVFKVDELRVYQGWAFVDAHSVQPNLKQIDFRKTRYREALEAGMFDGDSTYALLRKVGNAWKVKAFVIGPTDVYWIGWMDTPFSAPKTLFPPPYGPR